MRVARFRIIGRLDSAGSPQVGTVVINRQTGLFTVRPLRRKRVYEMPLAIVAEVVCKKIIIAELIEKRKAKKGRRAC